MAASDTEQLSFSPETVGSAVSTTGFPAGKLESSFGMVCPETVVADGSVLSLWFSSNIDVESDGASVPGWISSALVIEMSVIGTWCGDWWSSMFVAQYSGSTTSTCMSNDG